MPIKSGLTGAAIAVAFFVGVWLYGGGQYRAGQADCQSARYVADLEAFRDESERLALISIELQERVNALNTIKPTVIERYIRVEVEKPLPADCRIDSERLQRINEGIRAANAAR